MFRKSLLASAIAVAVTASGTAVVDHKGGFVFKPIDESANAANWDAAAGNNTTTDVDIWADFSSQNAVKMAAMWLPSFFMIPAVILALWRKAHRYMIYITKVY